MAAIGPKDYTYYSKNCFCAKVSGSDKVIHLYPLAKSAYASDANFKSYFYVDDIFTWVDNESKNCVVGMCTENSDNYNHHAAARRSYMRINKGSTTYQVMNDGGLNTMPHAAFISSIPNTAVKCRYANYIKILCNLYSAYFIDTSAFNIYIYKNGSEIYSVYCTPISGQATYPAQQSKTNYASIIKDMGGVSEGDQLTVKITATNTEGTYENPTTLTFTVLAPVHFLQVYRFTSQPTSSTNPTSGDPYLMIVDQSMYRSGSGGASGGVLYRLFNLTADSWLNLGSDQTEWLQGTYGTIEDIDTATFGDLPDGWYYGVPSTWEGSTIRYVRIYSNTSTTKQLSWMGNPYVSTSYNLAITLSGVHHVVSGNYTIYVTANLSGVWSGNVSVTVPIYKQGRTPTFLQNVTGSGSASSFQVGSFTYTGSDDLVSIGSTGTPTANQVTEGSVALRNLPEDNT